MFRERIAVVQQLKEAIAQHRDEFITTTIADLGFTHKDCVREVDLTLERLPAFADSESLLAGRWPLCHAPEDEVALLLPYDGSAWLNVAIISIWLAGNRVRVKFSSKGSGIARLTERLYRPLFGDAVRFVHEPGKQFLRRALDDPHVPAIVVFGSDENTLPYEDEVRRTGKKLIFEGPGNDPFIVFDDADLDAALDDLVDGKYRYSGQTCTAPERILVQAGVYDSFVREFVERSQALRFGDPADPHTDLVPLASEIAVHRIREYLADAVQRGGKVLCGGQVEGLRVEPTVVAEATPQMKGMRRELFGPVAFVARFESANEALALARDNRYGLRATVWSRKEGGQVAEALRGADYLEEVRDYTFGKFGTVAFNEPRAVSWRRALITKPIGGYGYSGWVWETVGERFVLRQGPKLMSLETST
jgi:succinate-semialdehyde dehydrogenase/glutarate-semialdehyde dehydrogenase